MKKPLKAQLEDCGKQNRKLVEMLLFIVGGLRKGTIKAKPIINTDPEATEWLPVSLEAEIWKTLRECGYVEKKETVVAET